MLLPRSFFVADETTYWSSLRIQLHFLLVEVAAWDGIIPLSERQLANLMQCTPETVHLLLVQCQQEGIVQKLAAGEYQLLKFVDYTNEENEQVPYIRHFAFLRSTEFRKEPVRVQRFVLEALARGVYSHNRIWQMRVKRLYHRFDRNGEGKIIAERGLFNIYSRQEMLDIIDLAKKYLDIDLRKNVDNEWVFLVKGIKGHYEQQGIMESHGNVTWVNQKLKKYGFELDFVNEEQVTELCKIMSHYVKNFGYSTASGFFDEALGRLSDSAVFMNLLYTTRPHEIGLFFKRVLESIEHQYAEQIVFTFESLEKEELECKLDSRKADVLEPIKRSINVMKKRIERIQEHWKRRLVGNTDTLLKSLMKKDYENMLVHMPTISHIIRNIKQQNEKNEEYLPSYISYNWLES